MARRNKKQDIKGPEILTVEDLLDLVDESDAVEGIFIGRNERGELLFYSTVPTAGYYHHLLNSAIWQLNVLENNELQALRQQEQETVTNDE